MTTPRTGSSATPSPSRPDVASGTTRSVGASANQLGDVMYQTLSPQQDDRATANPWHALWAMLVGFFMILVDATIVSVANPSIMDKLQTDYDAIIWGTSAYLLAYAVPLLVAGRLGD